MRHYLRGMGFVVLVGAIATSALRAQELPQLFPGVSVQVPGRFAGVLTRVTADTLFLLTNSGVSVALPRTALDTILVAGPLDRARGARNGALLGGALGVVLGAVVWLGGFEQTGDALFFHESGRKAGPGDAAFIVGVGLVSGAIYGAATGWQRWYPVAVRPAHLSVTAMTGGRVGLSVRLR